jgi:dTDP-4-dehydrorhamnose reductase
MRHRDVYEQHSPRILGITQIFNPTYATTIAIASHAALQAAIAHHGTVLNNPNLVTRSQLLKGLKCESQTKNSGKTKSQGTLLGSQHFRGVEGRVQILGWD